MVLPFLCALALAGDPPTVEAAPGKGVTFTTADGAFQMKIGARFQVRELLELKSPDADGDRQFVAVTQIRTARLGFQGYVLNDKTRYSLVLAMGESDYREAARSPVHDAYLDLRQLPNASFRIGQTLLPFDRARTTREFATQFSDRQKPVAEFALDRSVGAYVYSDHFLGEKSPVAYRLGVFGSNGVHLTTAQPLGAIFVGRVELRPLGPVDDDIEGDQQRRHEPGLAIGAAAAYSLDSKRVRSTTGAVFPDDAVDYFHFATDLVLKWYGVTLYGEFLGRNADTDAVTSEADPAVTQYTRSGLGWFVQPAYAFTPKLELALRYSETMPFKDTDPTFVRTHEVGAAFNVYLNGHAFKVTTDWETIWSDDFNAAGYLWHIQTDITF